ncbi:polycystic kidney disease and receptor for egg jelly-related protein-like [Anneissia japonica]|uniref:polycystic kidney disease and receptor for egg jelly-related protein-like n=1 Tax=Anneissia japonica TaxID=1529436 RepID=UPI0014258E99|nr:polycystic kidney disease and receptor for egg jelly-related protein-like [Anneissia japonica]
MILNENGDYSVSVDFRKPETVTGVLTRGCPHSTTGGTFTVEYSGNDDIWMRVSDRNGSPMVFNFNSDASTTELSRLPYPIIARNFKMNVDSSSCFHFEPVGCYSPLICRTSLTDVSKYRTNNGVLNTNGSCFDVDGVDWFEFDVSIQRSISGIITKNLLDFQVEYSQEKYNWVTLLNDNGTNKTFTVTNQDNKTANMFYTADDFVDTLYARYLRIFSSNWPDGEFCLELIGCEGNGLLLFTSNTDANIPVEFAVYNEISRVNFSTEAFIQTPIADFQVHQTPILNFDSGYDVELTSAHGSDLHLNATFNDTDLEQSDLQFNDSTNSGFCELRNEVYPTFGNFVVSVTAENEVSGPRTDNIVVHIQVVILGLRMEPTINYLSTNETMFLDYTSNGTEILMLFEFGDQTSVEIYHNVLFGNPQRVNHTYIRPDVYLIYLYAQNNISSEAVSYPVVVENPVVAGEIRLTPNSPGRIDSIGTGNGTLDVQYDFLGDVHDFPTNATAMYNITGMETKQQHYSLIFDVNTKRTYHPLYLHTYGIYYIDIFISNHISYINYSIEIEMEQPIENLAIFTSHKYQRVNWNVTFHVNTTWGSRVTFVVDFGDSSTYTISNQSWFEVSHSYNDSGVYPVTVYASNLIGNVSARMATDQFIQYPVDGVKLHSQEINLLPFVGVVSGVVLVPFFVFQNQNISLPTNVTFIVYFNTSVDNPISNDIALAEDDCILPSSVFQLDGFNLTQCFNQNYSVEGDYHVCIDMWNEVSNGTECRDFTILEQITQVRAHVYYIDVNENGNKSEEPAHEFEGNIYVPLDRQVLVNISYSNGTGITYYWDFNDTYKDSINVTDIPEALYEYTYPGIYEVMINSSNPVFSVVTSVKIDVQGAMRNLTITGPGPKDETQNVEFTLTASIFGTSVCYRFEYFDVQHCNSSVVFTGDQYMCEMQYNVTEIKVDPDIDKLWETGFNGSYASLLQVHKFNETCIHNVSINASNIVSYQFRFIQQIITKKPCFFPVVSVKKLNLCNENFNCDKYGNRAFKSADVIMVFSEVTISCQTTNVAYYNWKLSDDKGPYSLPDNVVTFGSPLPVLSIPRASFGINYGTYEISLTVKMDEECGLETTDSTQITVESSDLQARISGGSYRTFGNSSTFEIDASEETIDPDSQGEESFTISWLCRQKKYVYNNETIYTNIEEFADKRNVTSSGKVNPEFEYAKKNNSWNITKGCFYNGTDKAGGHLTEFDNELKISVKVEDFQPGFDMEYEFMLVISQGDREATARQTIFVQQNDPPDIKLKCVLNCQERTNPSGRFSLQSVLNVSNPEAYTFWWNVYTVNVTSYKEIGVDYESFSATGRNSANFVINKNYFESGLIYNVELTTSWQVDSKHRATAQTRWEVSANDFPQVGICDVEPLAGFAVNTTFMIECSNFTDVDKPIRYEFSVKSRNSSIWTTIYSGLESKLPNRTPLPQGDFPDYELLIRVRAYDKYRACSEDLNMTVNVQPWDDSEEVVNELIDKEVDDIRELVGGGNIVSSANKATSLTQLLNTMSQNTTSNDTSLGYKSYNATEERIKKEKRLAKRNDIIGYLNQLNPQDLGDLAMMTSTINEAIAVPDETSSEAKNTTITMVEKLAIVMSSQANEIVTSADDIEGSASSVLEVLGSLQVPPTTDSINGSESVSQISENNNRTQSVIDSMMENILNKMVVGQENVRVDSTDITASCSRSSKDNLREKKVFDQGDGISMTVPNMTNFFKDLTDEQVDIQVIARKNNPFQYDNSSSLVSGRVVSMDMLKNGSRMEVQNLTERIEVFIVRDTIKPAVKENETTDEVKMYGNTTAPGLDLTVLIFQNIERDRSLSVSLTSLGQKNMEIGQSYNYTIFLYLKANSAPKEDYGQYDNLCVLSGQTVKPYERYYASDDEAYPRPWNDTHDYLSEVTGDTNCFYSNSLLNSLSNSSLTTFYVGVRHKMGLNRTVNGTSDGGFQQMRFEATFFISQCLYLDETSGEWRFEGLEVGPESTRTRTQCLSDHLTSFGSGFSVPMNTVNLGQSPFSSLNENPVVFVFMVCCMMLYLTVILWARKADQRDLVMAGVTPLKDNDPRDKIKYEITVFTGVKKRSGTSATVSFMISGDEGGSGIRVFQDEKRKIFERGGIDTFILTTKRTLGQLIHIRIWHNNKGKHPSWFLSRISIKDLQTNRVYYFMLEKWLAVEEEDGQIERIIPAAGRSELTSFGLLFHSKTRKNLKDSHLWFSVFFRPSKSNFTRVQRATCCLSLLFSTMMANIIFYGVDMINTGGPVIKLFGPIEFSLTQVVTGIISSLMVFPTSLFTVQLFRTSEPKPEGARFFCRTKRKKARKSEPIVSSISSSLQTETKTIEKHQDMHDLLLEKENMATPPPDSSRSRSRVSRHSTASNNSVHIEMKPALTEKIEESKEHLVLGYKVKRKKRKRYLLNWRFKYFAWFIAVANIGVAFWLTISYAAAFGAKKANEWLTSIAIALCQDVLVSQPIKVILIAVFFSLVIKNPIKEDDDSPPPPELDDGEELLHERMTEEELENAQMLEEFERERADMIASSMPPDTEEIAEARETRFKEIRMHIIVREIIIYILFLYVLMFVSFGNTDHNSYLLRQSSVETYVNAAYNGKLKFTKVSKREHFWNWTDNVLLPSLFPVNLSNTLLGAESIQFVADQQSYLIGVPQFRQLRIEKDKCHVPDVMKPQFKQDCRVPYSYGDEEVANFQQGWKPITNESLTPNYDENMEIGSWKYHYWYDLKKLPFWGNVAWYSGGGYIAQLGSTLDEGLAFTNYLRETDWLDQYTRAIFIEFAVYNPAMDFYTISYLMADFLPQGGMMGYVDFQVTSLKTIYNLNFMGYVMLSLEAIFLLFVLFFTYTELKKFLKLRRKYFKEKENIVDLITLAIAITAVCMYFYCLFESMSLISEREQAPTELLNFQYVVQWETYFTWMMSFVLFVYTIKFLKLLRFNYRLRLFCETVMFCWYEVLLFLIMFGVIFIAYTCCGYLLFSQSLIEYVTMVTTMESLFSFLLGKFNFESLVGVDKILGPLFFISFALISIFILMNMFLTVIIEAFCVVKHTSSENIKNDLEIVDFMIYRFKLWTGFAEKRLKKPVKPPQKYIPGIDPVQVECDELKDKLTCMVDKLNMFIRKERIEVLGPDSFQSDVRSIFTSE